MGKDAGKGLKVLGVGLSRTGTVSLMESLETLGYRTIHFADQRLLDVLTGAVSEFDFRCFDDIDAVVDVPAAHFYNEILAAYPDCKAILTVREIESWFNSVANYDKEKRIRGWFGPKEVVNHDLGIAIATTISIRRLVYGTLKVKEVLYKKSFTDHNRRVINEVDSDRLLVMDIFNGDGWDKLCAFLNVPIPDEPFPALNAIESWRKKRSYNGQIA